MAGNEVTLTFAGDEKRLTESMERVGQASDAMTSRVGKASGEIQNGSKSLDSLTESADTAETRSQGFSDVLTGVTEGMAAWNDESLSGTEKLIAMGQAGADLAGGLAGFLLPALQSVAGFMRGGLAAAMTFIAAHPIMLTIGLLAAGVIYLITQTEWFSRVATQVFNWVGNLAKNVFNATVGWVINRWNDLVSWFERLPEYLGKAFGAVGDFIGRAFRGALNVAIDILNWFVRRANDLITGINHVNPFENIPHIPQISRLHQGGIVPGAPGSETMAILKAGEEVTAANRVAGGGAVQVRWAGNTDTAFATAFMNLYRDGVIQIEVI